ALGTFFLVFVLFISVLILKKSKSKSRDFMFDLKTFEPGELDRLKGKGLLTEEEAKKVQAVIANRAVEWSEQLKKEKETAPVDINTLLAEADHYRRKFEQSKAESPSPKNEEGSEEDNKE
ncbi:MAG: hypothetical protein KC944_21650, partial [Candidatus Omnitrophica bacterium]|nr:hypothetical protein [Candidatus Omnitrophota bacterium]